MTDAEYYKQRKQFEEAMHSAGWHEIRDIWKNIYDWEHENRHMIDDRSAFDFWRLSRLTPAPW